MKTSVMTCVVRRSSSGGGKAGRRVEMEHGERRGEKRNRQAVLVEVQRQLTGHRPGESDREERGGAERDQIADEENRGGLQRTARNVEAGDLGMLARDHGDVFRFAGVLRELQLLDERLGHRTFGACAHLHEDPPDLTALLFLQMQGGTQALGFDVPVAQQELADLVPPSLAALVKGRDRRSGRRVAGAGFDWDVATDPGRLRGVFHPIHRSSNVP